MEYEQWIDIKGYEGIYQVSNFGQVKSLRRPMYIPGVKVEYFWPEASIKPQNHTRGYLTVYLSKGGSDRKFFIHRLVAQAFLPDFQDEVVNHRDGDKTNNRFDNLEWMSAADNTRHYFHGVDTMEERNAAF